MCWLARGAVGGLATWNKQAPFHGQIARKPAAYLHSIDAGRFAG